MNDKYASHYWPLHSIRTGIVNVCDYLNPQDQQILFDSCLKEHKNTISENLVYIRKEEFKKYNKIYYNVTINLTIKGKWILFRYGKEFGFKGPHNEQYSCLLEAYYDGANI